MSGWISRCDEECLVYRYRTQPKRLSERYPRRLLDGKYALHRLRHPQEDDQLLHKGPAWERAGRGHGGGHAAGSGRLDEIPSSTVDCCDGSDHVHELDL